VGTLDSTCSDSFDINTNVKLFELFEVISSSYKAVGISVYINADNVGVEGRYDSELFLELLGTEFYSILWAVN
jgi:hypothetical protein